MGYGEWVSSRQKRLVRSALIDGQYSNYSKNLEDRMSQMFSLYGESPYWQQFLSNPYLRLPSYFDPKMVTGSNYDYWADFMGNYELNALTEIQRLQRLAYEEKYDTPLEQVKREQAAGLNPNLSGSIDSGAASEGTELPVASLPSMAEFNANRFQQGMGLFDAGQSFLNAFFGIAQNVQSMKMGNLQVADSELSLLGKSSDSIFDYISSHLPVLDDAAKSDPDIFYKFFDDLVGNFDFSPYSKRTRKFLKQAFDLRNLNPGNIGFKSRYIKGSKDTVSNVWSLADLLGKKGYDTDFQKMLTNVVDNYSNLSYDVWKKGMELQEKMSDFQNKVYQGYEVNNTAVTQSELQTRQLENELNYQNKLTDLNVPARKAESESKTLHIKELQDAITEYRTSAMDRAEKEFDRIQKEYLSGDSWYQVVGRLALPFLRSLVSQAIMSYSQSATHHLAQLQFGAQPVQPNFSDISSEPLAE